jgi:hypothetical protein
MEAAFGFSYTFSTESPPPGLAETIEHVMSADTLEVTRGGQPKTGRRRVKPKRTVNIRPMIHSLELRVNEPGQAVIDVEIEKVENRSVRIRELLDLLGLEPARTQVLKRATQLARELEAERHSARRLNRRDAAL